jgi:ubiquinone/menaquinone biosynthesis C-methylase UbiE
MKLKDKLTDKYMKLTLSLRNKRIKAQSSALKNTISKGMHILDVGSGSGELAKNIAERYNVKITCVDVSDWNKTDLELVLYNGRKLPFKDNSFDAVMFSFVLHHCEQKPKKMLLEAKRVSKNKVIFFEDTPANSFDRFLCAMHANFFRIWHVQKSSCQFHSKNDWKAIINNSRLKLVGEKKLPRMLDPFYPITRMLFVASKVK